MDNNITHTSRPVRSPNPVSHHDRFSCAFAEQINYKLLENRLHLLESQHQMMNNLHLQNQIHFQSRERYAPFLYMGPIPHFMNPPIGYSTPTGYVLLNHHQPHQTHYVRYHVPPNISGHYLPQSASNPYVHGHPITKAAVPIIPHKSWENEDNFSPVTSLLKHPFTDLSIKMVKYAMG